jgi:hypothetical protein
MLEYDISRHHSIRGHRFLAKLLSESAYTSVDRGVYIYILSIQRHEWSCNTGLSSSCHMLYGLSDMKQLLLPNRLLDHFFA